MNPNPTTMPGTGDGVETLHAMLTALRGREAGLGLQDLWPAWRDATGLSRSSLNVLLHGAYASSTARTAYRMIAIEAKKRGRSTGLPRLARRTGAIPRLTCDIILQIRTSALQGASVQELAERHQITRLIARDIVQGNYHTAAMRQALAMEQVPGAAKDTVLTI